jgi:hypothetical protein
LGSDLMMAQVADRLEGRPAMRSGESDVDEAARAEQVRRIEEIVRLMNDRGSTRPGDNAREITVDAAPSGNGGGRDG